MQATPVRVHKARAADLCRAQPYRPAPRRALVNNAVAQKVPPAAVDEIVAKLKQACKSQSVAPKVVFVEGQRAAPVEPSTQVVPEDNILAWLCRRYWSV